MKSPVPRRHASGHSPVGRRFNALTHGLNSGCVLIPGDNVAQFRKHRTRLFEYYRPRTCEEAQCVETLAACQWRIDRCRLEQSGFKQHLGAVMDGHPDVTGHAGPADPHRLHHRGTDCSLEETRWLRVVKHTKAELRQMQTQRSEHMTAASAASLEDHRVFLAEGEPVVEWEDEPQAQDPSATDAKLPASGSSDSRSGKNLERAARSRAGQNTVRNAERWNGKNRTALARRNAGAAGVIAALPGTRGVRDGPQGGA